MLAKEENEHEESPLSPIGRRFLYKGIPRENGLPRNGHESSYTNRRTVGINATPKAVFESSPMKNLQQLLVTGTLLAGVLTIATSVLGAPKLWSGAAGATLWSSGGNWSPAGVPIVSDNVTFTNDGVTNNSIVLGGSV